MKPGYKILIGVGSLVAIGFLTKDYWMGAKAAEVPNTPLMGGNATALQFDTLVELGTAKGSSLFANANADKLLTLRNNFISHLSNADAIQLLSLLNKNENTWEASDKINYAALVKKWTGAPIPATPNIVAKPLVSMPVVVAPSIQTGTGYNILKDADYSKKSDVLGKWYDYIKAENKKRFIPRIVPAKNTFVSRFVPMSLNDLEVYTSLAMKGEKNRDAKEEFTMKNLRAKYPVPFEGKTVLYSFTGSMSNVQLSNMKN